MAPERSALTRPHDGDDDVALVSGLARVIGVAMPVFFIGDEKKAPFRCGVWKVTIAAIVLVAITRS